MISLNDITAGIEDGSLSKEDAIRLMEAYQSSDAPKKSASNSPILTKTFLYHHSYVKDHIVNKERILLGVTYCSLGLTALQKRNNTTPCRFKKVLFLDPVTVLENVDTTIAVYADDLKNTFYCQNLTSDGAYTVATGNFDFPNTEGIRHKKTDTFSISQFIKTAKTHAKKDELYSCESQDTIWHGPSLQTVQDIYINENTSLARLELQETLQKTKDDYAFFHPAILDGVLFSAVSPLLLTSTLEGIFVPMMIKEISILADVTTDKIDRCYSFNNIVKKNNEIIEINSNLLSEKGEILVKIKGFICKRFRNEDMSSEISKSSSLSPSETANIDPPPSSLPHSDTADDSVSIRQANDDLVTAIKSDIKHTLKRLLETSKDISDMDNFMDIGVDSNQLISIVQDIEKKVGIELYPTLFFEYQNIDELSHYFAEEHTNEFRKYLNISTMQPSESPPLELAEQQSSENNSSGLKDSSAYTISPQFEKFTPPFFRTLKNSHTSDSSQENDVAIIGMAGEFAKSKNVDIFWENIVKKADLMTEIPQDHFDFHPWYSQKIGESDKMYCKWGSFIDNVGGFDANFFNISPREAELMDPQLRKLLQVMYHTTEDAGYAGKIKGSRTGNFVGVCFHDYGTEMLLKQKKVDAHDGTGNAATMLANRPSFYFNFRGPSLAVDTACSSSLYSLHLACKAVLRGECDLAFASGVNLLLTSAHYRYFCSLGALSPTGRCHTFDDRADGYVPGEAIGAVLLKPLSKARADGDRIHAIIKGSATSHGGYTPSITAPSVDGEVEVLTAAWKDAGISPETLGYIEAHGTGTKLGDPIEFNALKKGFKSYTKNTEFCGLGSAKAHIGHAEGAAGIAGVIKAVKSMQNECIPAMPTFDTLNSYIKIDSSPFFINTDPIEWTRQHTDSGEELPRRAGVSSFGFGGAYAHIVLEEYPHPSLAHTHQKQAAIPPSNKPNSAAEMIILSAKKFDILKQRASDLNRYLDKVIKDDTSQYNVMVTLKNIAYTLHVGREHMEHRLGIIAYSIDDLLKKLPLFINGESHSDIFNGHSATSDSHLGKFQDEDIQDALSLWISKKKYGKFLDLWTSGLTFDWESLYTSASHQLLSLPTYPFDHIHYWANVSDSNRSTRFIADLNHAHPLVQTNVSNLYIQRFMSLFTGEEFFFKDHVVNGHRTLPGAAYLEMVGQTVKQSLPYVEEDGKTMSIRNLVWLKPMVISGNDILSIDLCLNLLEEERLAFSIHSTEQGSDSNQTVYCEGQIFITNHDKQNTFFSSLDQLLSSFSTSVSPEVVYHAFERMGITYGSSFRTLQSLHIADKKVLAQVSLPSAEKESDTFTLDPRLIDALFQACIGLSDAFQDSQFNSKSIPLSLPFALDQLDIFAPLPSEVWVYITYLDDQNVSGRVKKLTIQVLDSHGTCVLRFSGFSIRTMTDIGDVFFRPTWIESEIDHMNTSSIKQRILAYAIDIPTDITLPSHVTILPQEDSNTKVATTAFETFSHHVFNLIKSELMRLSKSNVLYQVVLPTQSRYQTISAVSALFKTAALENPRIQGQVIAIEEKELTPKILDMLIDNSHHPQDTDIRYKNNQRFVRRLTEFTPDKSALFAASQTLPIDQHTAHNISLDAQLRVVPFKEDGVYLITGGSGGLGMLMAKTISQQSADSTIILTGRSTLTASIKDRLASIRHANVTLNYIQNDVTDSDAVHGLITDILSTYSRLDGIIVCSGSKDDGLIIKKEETTFLSVLQSKVRGTYHLDHASKAIALDFFITFSSVAALVGNPGQSDYATANAFQDEFIYHRHQMVKKKKRFGASLSINWPLWKDGGMTVSDQNETHLRTLTGMSPIESEHGMAMLQHIMSLDDSNIFPAYGDKARIRQWVSEHINRASPLTLPVTTISPNKTDPLDSSELKEKTSTLIRRELSLSLKLPEDQIDITAPLETYGIDSVLIVELTNRLESLFGTLSKTLFFEYQTLEEVIDYFLEDHKQQLQQLFFATETPDSTSSTSIADTTDSTHANDTNTSVPDINSAPQRTYKKRFLSHLTTPQRNTRMHSDLAPLDIAVIGASGQYPKAKNLHIFWDNLKNGIDCITEVPSSRWKWQDYYSEDRTKKGAHFSKWGGFIDDVDMFDPLFFNISPRDAMFMDPQERLYLEHVWSTIEDAGYTRDVLNNYQVGVYTGTMYEEYQLFGAEESLKGHRIALTGSPASISNRVSYFFNFRGPSITLDTMCSSSLTTVHLACQDLRAGRIDYGIAGGVNISIHPNKYLLLSGGQFISTKGHCESFGAGGDGYIPSEGVGSVMLKRLEDAIHDGDHIYGIIKGSAINHGGKTNGYTVPNPKAQRDVITHALNLANIDADTISYVEAHGTGTVLGDPIEITSLHQAYGKPSGDRKTCFIGSAKSNIGHAEGAAGIAGLSKVLLQLKHRQIAPSLHSKELNPNINFDKTPFIVNQTLRNWEQPIKNNVTIPRRAGLSSFGAGGSNAHIVIEEYTQLEPTFSASESSPFLIVLSAKSIQQLQLMASHLAHYTEQHRPSLRQMAYTLQIGREAFEKRLAIITSSTTDLISILKQINTDLHKCINESYSDLEETSGDKCFFHEVSRQELNRSITNKSPAYQNQVHQWLEQRDLSSLATEWVKGAAISWSELYKHPLPKKISLPTYVFNKKRHWFTPTSATYSLQNNDNAAIDISTPRVQKLSPSRITLPLVSHGRQLGLDYIREGRRLGESCLNTYVGGIQKIVWGNPVKDGDSTSYDILQNTHGRYIYKLFNNEKKENYHFGEIIDSPVEDVQYHLDYSALQSSPHPSSKLTEWLTFNSIDISYAYPDNDLSRISQNELTLLCALPDSIRKDRATSFDIITATAWQLIIFHHSISTSTPYFKEEQTASPSNHMADLFPHSLDHCLFFDKGMDIYPKHIIIHVKKNLGLNYDIGIFSLNHPSFDPFHSDQINHINKLSTLLLHYRKFQGAVLSDIVTVTF